MKRGSSDSELVTRNKHEVAFPYMHLEAAPNLSHSLLCSVGLGTHGAYRKAEWIQTGDFSFIECLSLHLCNSDVLPASNVTLEKYRSLGKVLAMVLH